MPVWDPEWGWVTEIAELLERQLLARRWSLRRLCSAEAAVRVVASGYARLVYGPP